MTNRKKPYHHGDLRNELIEKGIEILSEDGAERLSLRKVARKAGVSHNAPYQHFDDKEALLAAIATEGFVLLEQEMDAITRRGGPKDPVQPVLDLAVGYVEFALAHQPHFIMMFGPLDQSRYPDLYQASQSALGKLIAAVGQAQSAGALKGGTSPEALTMPIWFLMHGIASAMISDKIPPGMLRGKSVEAITRPQLEQLLAGLRS